MASHLFQSLIQLQSPFFFRFTNGSNKDSTRPIKLTLLGRSAFSATHASENTLKCGLNLGKVPSQLIDEANGLPIKPKMKDLDFEERTSRFRVKNIVDRIRALPSNTRSEILHLLEKDGELQNISDFNYLLMALIVAKEPEICLGLFANLSSYQVVPDCWTYSIMIRCFCEKNDLEQAKRVLDAMLEDGFQPNVVTITVFINSLCKRGRMQKALEVFELMGVLGCEPNVQTLNCLLKGLCYVGKVEEAVEMLMNIKNSSMKPDIYSYTAVMDGLCKVGRSDEAKELLHEAVEMGLAPNVVTFNTLFQGYSREGKPLQGVAVLNLMKKRNCVPDYISYCTLLHGLLKWNEIRAALHIFKEMAHSGYEGDERMMGTLVRRLCRKSWTEIDLLEDANQLFEKMKRRHFTVDQRTHELMIQALCVGKMVDEALTNLNDMITLGYSPGAITFDEVIQALCAQGRAEDAVSTLLLTYANGKFPNITSLNVLINELNAQGRLRCAYNLFGAALKQGVIKHSCKSQLLKN